MCREPSPKIGVEKSEGTNRPGVPDDSPQHPVSPILSWTKAIAVLDACAPPSDRAFPHTDVILDAHVLTQNFAAPTVVIAGNHQHIRSRFLEFGECSEHTEARAWNDR